MPVQGAEQTEHAPVGGLFAQVSRGMRRLVWRLAWPVAAERLALSVLAAVDAALVGRYVGADGVAAVGVGTLLLWLPLVGAFGGEVAVTALVARDTGRGAPEDAVRSLHAGTVAAALWGLLCGLALALGAGGMLRLMGVEPAIVPLGKEFLIPAAAGVPFLLLMYAANGALRGVGNTLWPMLALLVVNVVNFAVTVGLISGVFGVRLGTMASGIGYAAAGVTGAALALAMVLHGSGGLRYRVPRGAWLPRSFEMRRFLRLAVPITLEELQFIVAFLLYTRIIARAGSDALAAHTVALRALEIVIVPGFALGTAATALVGQALGMGRADLATRSALAARALSLVTLVVMSAVLAATAPWSPRLFVDDPAVVATTTRLLLIFALALPGIGVAAALAGALRGAGDVRFVLIATSACTWLVRLPVAWVCAVLLGWGAPGAWLGAVAENNLRAVVVTGRFSSGRWTRIEA